MTTHVQESNWMYYSYISNCDIRGITLPKELMKAPHIHFIDINFGFLVPSDLPNAEDWKVFRWSDFDSYLILLNSGIEPFQLCQTTHSEEMAWIEVSFDFSMPHQKAIVVIPTHHLGQTPSSNPGYTRDTNWMLPILKWEFSRLFTILDKEERDKVTMMSWFTNLLIRLKSIKSANALATDTASVHALISLEQELSTNLQLPIPPVKMMADQVNMSHSSFKVFFKTIFKESPHKYFLKKRIDYAIHLLSSTDFPINKVAYHVGFMDPSGLTKLFQRELGINPMHYRKVI